MNWRRIVEKDFAFVELYDDTNLLGFWQEVRFTLENGEIESDYDTDRIMAFANECLASECRDDDPGNDPPTAVIFGLLKHLFYYEELCSRYQKYFEHDTVRSIKSSFPK